MFEPQNCPPSIFVTKFLGNLQAIKPSAMSMSGSLGFDFGSCCIAVAFKLGGTCFADALHREAGFVV